MKTMKSTYVIMAVIVSMLWSPEIVTAAESTLAIDLSHRIKAGFRSMQGEKEALHEHINSIDTKINDIDRRHQAASSREEKDELEGQYFTSRADGMLVMANYLNHTDRIVFGTINNMQSLSDELQKINGNARGNGTRQLQASKASEMIKGLGQIVMALGQTSHDNARVAQMQEHMRYVDERNKQLFSGNGLPSLDKEILFMQDIHAFIATLKQLVNVERVNLMTMIYKGEANEIVDGIMTFSKSVVSDIPFLGKYRDRDERYSGGTQSHSAAVSKPFNPDELGNY